MPPWAAGLLDLDPRAVSALGWEREAPVIAVERAIARVTAAALTPVSHASPDRGAVALDRVHHVGEGEGLEVLAHVLADLGPDGEQDALALVVARPVLVG